MRVFVSGPSAELDRVRGVVAAVEAAGHDVVGRWWEVIERDREGRPTDDGAPTAILARAWDDNITALLSADAVLSLARDGGGLSNGTREELAVAAARSVYTVLVGDPGASPLTGLLRSRGVVVDTVADAVAALGRGR